MTLYVLTHTYVCGNGCMKKPPEPRWQTIDRVFFFRPDGCRYAVVETVRKESCDLGLYHVIDFFHPAFEQVPLILNPSNVRHGSFLWHGDALDGLTMKAMMCYDRE